MTIKEQIFQYADSTYHTTPDHPFPKFQTYVALRHADNKKWYALFMDVPRKKLGISGDPDEYVDIVNLKCDPDMRMMIVGQAGILPSYHMKASNWISVLLDGSVSFEKIIPLLDLSFELTSSKTRSKSGKPHNPYWIIPANPKYYDLEAEIEKGMTEFTWKQSNSIHAGDTVYIYVAAPVRAIRYECQVLETDIPYTYKDDHLSMKKVMNLRLTNTFTKDVFSIQTLKSHGVTAVRGPRSVPASLLHELKHYTAC